MMGKFDLKQTVSANRQTITAAGPIEWAPGDQGRKVVEMRVEFKPTSGTNCNGRVPPPNGATFDQGRDTRWSFEMPNNGMALGLATAKGEARLDNGTVVKWEQGVLLAVA
jgi:hypothetical protein